MTGLSAKVDFQYVSLHFLIGGLHFRWWSLPLLGFGSKFGVPDIYRYWISIVLYETALAIGILVDFNTQTLDSSRSDHIRMLIDLKIPLVLSGGFWIRG